LQKFKYKIKVINIKLNSVYKVNKKSNISINQIFSIIRICNKENIISSKNILNSVFLLYAKQYIYDLMQ